MMHQCSNLEDQVIFKQDFLRFFAGPDEPKNSFYDVVAPLPRPFTTLLGTGFGVLVELVWPRAKNE